MSTGPSSATIRLENGDEEHCIIITKPSKPLSIQLLRGSTITKKINKAFTGWAKVLVNNTFILYTHAIDDEDTSEKSIDDDGQNIIIMEVPHAICDRTFAKLHSDYLINHNNFLMVKQGDIEKKVPIVPSYLFAHRRAFRKFSTQIAKWWNIRRSTFPESNRTKDRRIFNSFCKRHISFANMKDSRRWFNQTIIQYENDLKANRDPMAHYANAPDFNDISKQSNYVAPAAARMSDVARAQVDGYRREQAKDDESESSESDSDSDSDSDEEEEEEEEKKTAVAAATKPVRRDFDADSDSDSDSDSDDEEEEETKPKAKKTAAVRKRAESSDSDSDSGSESEEEVEVKPKKKSRK